MRMRLHLLPAVVFLPIAVVVAAEALAPPPVAAAPQQPQAVGQPRLEPVFQRVEVAAGATRHATLRMAAGLQPLRIQAVQTDCACLALERELPIELPARGALELPLRVVGVRAGIKRIAFVTDRGRLEAHVQVVSDGLGDGLRVLEQTAQAAVAAGATALVAVVHDLQGATDNCGCSSGSLGGAEHLAALPAWWRAQAPGVPARWVLTGDVDGQRPGVGAALAASGWTLGDPAVAAGGDIGAALQRPGVAIVVASAAEVRNHRALLRPVLDRGMVVELCLLDAQGLLLDRHTLPVDRALPSDAAVLARLPAPALAQVDTTRSPSADCATCHPNAARSWAASRHAHALDSLRDDRRAACVTCHTTTPAEAPAPPVAHVHCQACHTGAAAHAASHGRERTTGTRDCRDCHDASHHPTFDRASAWRLIQHAREADARAR